MPGISIGDGHELYLVTHLGPLDSSSTHPAIRIIGMGKYRNDPQRFILGKTKLAAYQQHKK
jgi:hypothetical protein